MKLFRERIGLKVFLSYLLIILIGGLVLILAAEFHAPTALSRHIARMQEIVGDDPELAADLLENFATATTEILLVAMGISVGAAIAISIFTSRRITAPIESMKDASRSIAGGEYQRRVEIRSEDELGSMARSFNRMAETLEKTEQRRLSLIGDLAHEFRTPLASIKGTMEALVDGVLPIETAAFIDVQREVNRMQRLVQDLEELSRAEAGQIQLEIQPVSPGDLIREAVRRLQGQYDDKEVDLKVDISAAPERIEADPQRLTQILLNLLGNALQFTPSGGEVNVEAYEEPGNLVVNVHDTGGGISEHDLGRIFERFYRVDKSRARPGGGSGVGLTIALHLVEAHSGRIMAESPGLDQGSTFTIVLPITS
jgi:histidine kinase